jgi:thioredoxin reductase (NADPH)
VLTDLALFHCCVQGNSRFQTCTNRKTGESSVKPIGSVFVMIGAEPNSGWLFGTVRLDKKGFILTGGTDGFNGTPYATSVPGMFAVGDVRSNSVKRVASAVGEGSVVISDVHRYLADHRNNFAAEPNSALAALRLANAATTPQTDASRRTSQAVLPASMETSVKA